MDFQRFDLNLLRSLDALLCERHVTRAARRMHVTQQAMSSALGRLREAFGDPLLVSVGRNFEFTALGAALAQPVRDLMLRIELTVETNPDFDASTSERRFAVAMSDYATATILPPVMALMSMEAPNLTLEVKLIGKTSNKDLERGDVDLCLLPTDWTLFGEEPSENVRSLALYQDDFVCVVSASNRSVGEVIDVEQYLAMPHASLRLGDGVRSVIEASWQGLGICPRVTATATSFSSMIFAVSDSALIATVQRRLARQFARMLPIRVLECPVSIDPLRASMSWRRTSDDDPAHRYLRNAFVRAGEIADLNSPSQ